MGCPHFSQKRVCVCPCPCLCITCDPDCTSSETFSGSHDLASLAAADIMGLVNHISGFMQILQTHIHANV